MRRLYDGWHFKQEDIAPECIYFVDVPRVYNEGSTAYFAKQLQRFKENLEQRYGLISEERLIETIKKYNLTRDLFNRVLELRKQDNPPVSGVEVARLISESMTMERDEFNHKLEAFIVEKEGASGNPGPRIMIFGGPTDASLAKLIEGSGGVVVYENMCNGLRYNDMLVDFDEGPVSGIARRYLRKNPCPRMLGTHADHGLEEIRRLVDIFRIDGIVYHSIKFCANLQFMAGIVKSEFNVGVPMKIIESDIGSEIDGREIRSFIKNLCHKVAGKEGPRK